MKKRFVIASCALVCALGLQAQELTIKVDSKGKIGFADAQGQQVVPFQYTSAQPFEEGISIVSKGDKFGAVNASGRQVVKPQYDEVSRWGNGLLLLKKGKKWGLASGSTGELVVPVSYGYISRPNRFGKAWLVKGGKIAKQMVSTASGAQEQKQVLLNGKIGIVDADGKIAIVPKQKALFEFSYISNNLLKGSYILSPSANITMGDTLATNCQYMGYSSTPGTRVNAGVMKGDGTIILQPKKHTYVTMPSSGMIAWVNTSKKNTTFGYQNVETKAEFEVLTVKGTADGQSQNENFFYVSDFHGDLAAVNTTSGEYQFIDKTGGTVQTGFQTVKHSNKSAAWAGFKKSGECILLNEKGTNLLPDGITVENVQFSETADNGNNLAVKKDGKWGVLDLKGNTVVNFDYESAQICHDVVVVSADGGKYGVVNLSNQTLVPTAYKVVFNPREAKAKMIWVVKDDNLCYAYNVQTKKVVTKGYDDVTNFFKGFAFVAPKDIVKTDNQTTRAMMGYNVTDEAFNKQWEKHNFGQIINENDEVCAAGPYHISMFVKVATMLQQSGTKKLTLSQDKALRLNLTKEQRSYPMKTKIDEGDWDF